MFLIMGISNGSKKLVFDQLEICRYCGKYGHMEVFMTYTYFMFFFIPIVKWNKRYYVKMSCCGRTFEISQELGKAIKNGEGVHINHSDLYSDLQQGEQKECAHCGYRTEEDFEYCPKCGNLLKK